MSDKMHHMTSLKVSDSEKSHPTSNSFQYARQVISRTAISPSALPEPTYLPQDPTKKSHARRQPRGHIPRPRNAFILFRCDFVRQQKVPQDVEKDHRNISRIVGGVWREMSEKDKAPWVEMAEMEKAMHHKVYPGYRYNPTCGGGSTPVAILGKRKKRGDLREAVAPISRHQDPNSPPVRRSSSCPPGAERISSDVTQAGEPGAGCGFNATLTTRDDLSRRPSHVVMYQSSPAALVFPTPLGESDKDFTFTHSWHSEHIRPTLQSGPYCIGPPGNGPGWDAAPPEPQEWQWQWSNQRDDHHTHKRYTTSFGDPDVPPDIVPYTVDAPNYLLNPTSAHTLTEDALAEQQFFSPPTPTANYFPTGTTMSHHLTLQPLGDEPMPNSEFESMIGRTNTPIIHFTNYSDIFSTFPRVSLNNITRDVYGQSNFKEHQDGYDGSRR